jgi:hypothetical protein
MKHRLLSLAVIAIVVASIFTFASAPTPAHAACTMLDVVGPWEGPVNFIGGHSVSYYRYDPDGDLIYFDTWTVKSSYTDYWGANDGERELLIDNSANCGSTAPLPLFNDGRENKNDALQTAAVYCGKPNAGDVTVYALFDQKGVIAFTVTKAQLAAGVQKPATPYLIKAAKGAELWRLQDGSLRIKRGTYVFDWPGC